MTLECKICGISDKETLSYIINHKFPPQYIGFISNYTKSKRSVQIEKLKSLVNVDKKKSKFVINKKKIKNLDERLKTSKTIELIKFSKKNLKNSKLYFIMGSDNIINLHKWHGWKKFQKYCTIVVFPRKGYLKKMLISKAYRLIKKDKLIFLKSRIANISSSKIRKNYLIYR